MPTLPPPNDATVFGTVRPFFFAYYDLGPHPTQSLESPLAPATDNIRIHVIIIVVLPAVRVIITSLQVYYVVPLTYCITQYNT